MYPPAHSRSEVAWGMALVLLCVLMVCILTARAATADLRLPATVEAGKGFSISVDGTGEATFYLIGPDHVTKRKVTLGGVLQVQSSDVRAAGQYRVIVCGASCTSASFDVIAGQPAHLSFFLHPSRVPVSTRGSIDATAFVLDQDFNLVLSPSTVDFKVTPASGVGFTRQGSTQRGVTWMRMDSTPHEGRVRVTAVLGKVQEGRVIQQVASEACGLRIKAQPSGKMVTLETDPVRDCSGNALPDGTVVSFTKLDEAGKSTVDVPIKKGVARVQMSLHGPAQISVACGVVVGNEVAFNGKS